MSNFLNEQKVGNIGLELIKEMREKTVSKWESTGFLEGLNGHVKDNIAILFENQAKELLKESTGTGAASGSFETVAFPIVRRVFSKLLANDIVSVQAMTMPIGKLFFYVPVTSKRDAEGNQPSMGAEHLPKCAAVDCEVSEFEFKNLYDRFYNDGLFDNSKGKASLITAAAATIVNLNNEGEFVAEAPAVAQDGTVRQLIVEVSGFSNVGAGRLFVPGEEASGGTGNAVKGNEMDTEEFLASLKVMYNGTAPLVDGEGNEIFAAGDEVPFGLLTQRYGAQIVEYADVCSADGKLRLRLDLQTPICVDCTKKSFDGYTGAEATQFEDLAADAFLVTWMKYDDLEFETELGEVSFRLDEVVVSVTERKLRAIWSPELAQDVSAFHNIDAEAELTALLSEQIAAEIDREILRDLRKGAAWQQRWDYNGWKRLATTATPYTQKEWNQELITVINQISAQIHKSTLRGGANWIVVSSEISAILDNLEYFHASNAGAEEDQYNLGIEKVGSISGRYQVYRDPYAPAWSMIIGHKGTSLLDTGFIYAPYTPMVLSNTLTNPFNFSNVKGIMTRYAIKMVNNRFYGHIRVDGVKTFDTKELR